VLRPLPIDPLLPTVVSTARDHQRFVLEAEAGAGKTTRVPTALLDAGVFPGEIWVAEPRRLAARLVAHRVATERGESLGERIGYTVRFEDKTSARTTLRYVTSGILLRRLTTDPELANISCVILDEFHERHLDTDLCLALLLELQTKRPDLRLIVMSATLDAERIAQHLGNCPRLFSEGRVFPLTVEFEPATDERPLEKRVYSAVRTLMLANPQGSILVFLPGAAEIRKSSSLISPLCEKSGFDLAVLHGDLPVDEQARSIEPGKRPRVVLTTNVAESSVTVEGITAVVDSGLARRLEMPTTSGISALKIVKVSRASATQRAGRAGRIAAGQVIRLYPKGEFETRPEHDTPEILRLDFSDALLMLYGSAVAHPEQLPLLDAPEPSKVVAARQLLQHLGAVDSNDQFTQLGRRMLALGIHPRLARLAIACAENGHPELGAIAAALLSERDIRLENRSRSFGAARRPIDVVAGQSDLFELVELYEWSQDLDFSPRALRDIGVDSRTVRTVNQAASRLTRILATGVSNGRAAPISNSTSPPSREQVLARAVLLAFTDRIAKRRTSQRPDFILRNGQVARQADNSVVIDASFIVAVDVDERRSPGRPPEVIIRIASAFDPNWLLDVAGDQLESEDELVWIDPPGRVEERNRIRLGSVTIDESRHAARPGPKTAEVLLAVAKERGLFRSNEITTLLSRLTLLKQTGIVVDLPDHLEASIETLAVSWFVNTNHLDGLNGSDLARSIAESLTPPIPECLRSDAPEQITLPGGKRCVVHYEPNQGPWIESRLQDFFGMAQTPTILRGRIPLTVHLLAPNLRAVQITHDLKGFWSTHYPSLRRQLMRRYPRHAWPEDGATAAPPEPRPTRR
jgi:ATP-dependent helicase HrpB